MIWRILRWAFISLGPEQKKAKPRNVVIGLSISIFSSVAPRLAIRRAGFLIIAPLSMAPVIHICMHDERISGQPPLAERAIRRLSHRLRGVWRHWLPPRSYGTALDPC